MGNSPLRNKIPNGNRAALLKGIGLLLLIIIGFSCFSRFFSGRGQTLSEYAAENPVSVPEESLAETPASNTDPVQDAAPNDSVQDNTSDTAPVQDAAAISPDRVTYQPDFYYEPLSDELRDFITGVSYPAEGAEEISYEDLRYVHVLHFDFNGESVEGELICNKAISQDLVEIFYELYKAEYQIEKMTLIDYYDGDDTASMADNNTSCFNYRTVDGTDRLSKHALGLAIDINPFYNPYVRYPKDGGQLVTPEGSESYADRTQSFPYKIDSSDLCYRLFTEHGFNWGGNWNSCKDYQHFEKVPR